MIARHTRRKSRGFTLVEVMAITSILAVMAAIAIPSYSRYVKRSRASEAVINLQRMWQSAVAYFQTEHTTPDGAVLGAQFPASSPITPSDGPEGGRYLPESGDWGHPTWDALNFSMTSAHSYQYVFVNRSNDGAPPGGGGAPFATDGPFASPGGPLGAGPFGGSDGKPGAMTKDDGQMQAAKPASVKSDKITVCHIPPGNPDNAHTIEVGRSSCRAHLAHGDFIGPCAGSADDDDTAESTSDDGDDSGESEASTGDDDATDDDTDDSSGTSDDDATDDDTGSSSGASDDDGFDDGDDVVGDDDGTGSEGGDDDGGDDGTGGSESAVGEGGDGGDDGGTGDPGDGTPGAGGDDDGTDGTADGSDPDEPPPVADGSDPFEVDSSVGACQHLFRDGGPVPGFYVVAAGNLDADEEFSFYYRGVTITPDCRFLGPPAVLNENPLE